MLGRKLRQSLDLMNEMSRGNGESRKTVTREFRRGARDDRREGTGMNPHVKEGEVEFRQN